MRQQKKAAKKKRTAAQQRASRNARQRGEAARRLAAETDRLRAAEPNPEQARLQAALEEAGLGEASIDNPEVQTAAAAAVRTQLDQEQALGALADRLAGAIADRLLLVPAALQPSDVPAGRVTTSSGWSGDGARFPGGEPSLSDIERKRDAAFREERAHRHGARDVEGPSIGAGISRVAPSERVPMQVAISNLGGAVSQLEESAAILQSRLGVVLPNRPEETGGATGGEGRGYAGTSDLVRGVEDYAARVAAVVSRIMQLAKDVEV